MHATLKYVSNQINLAVQPISLGKSHGLINLSCFIDDWIMAGNMKKDAKKHFMPSTVLTNIYYISLLHDKTMIRCFGHTLRNTYHMITS